MSAMLVTGLFVGCSAEPNEQSNATAEESKEVTTVTVWSNNRHDSAYMEEKIADFNANNEDNIFIDYVIQADNYDNMILMAASSDQMPDIFKQVDNPQEFVEAGIVQPINDYVTEEFKTITNYDDVLYRGYNLYDEDVYFIPTGKRSGMRLIYNKEIFEKDGITIPTTLDEMVQAAKEITEKGEGQEYGVVIPGLSAPFVRMFQPMAESSGVVPYDYVNGEFNFDGYKAIIEGFREMYEDGSVLPGAQSMKVDPTRVQFSEGNVGFYGNASQEVGVLTEQFPAKEEWSVAAMPTLTGEVKGTLSSRPNLGWMMSKDTKVSEAAWKVIEFFSSEEFLKGYIEDGLNLPLGEYMQSKVDLSLAGKLGEFAPLPYEGVYPTIPSVTPEGTTYEDALWEACVSSDVNIDETIEMLNKNYNEALDKEVEMGKTKRLVIKDFDIMNPQAGTFEYLDK
jgi:multiple sugar transport system substrate-binding protein